MQLLFIENQVSMFNSTKNQLKDKSENNFHGCVA